MQPFLFKNLILSLSVCLIVTIVVSTTGCRHDNNTGLVTQLTVSHELVSDEIADAWIVLTFGDHIDSLRMYQNPVYNSHSIQNREIIRVLTDNVTHVGVSFSLKLRDGSVHRDSLRQVPLNHFISTEPKFHFNTSYEPTYRREVVFSVNMSNQIVLGFFNPERGDKVHIQGDFYGWPAEGIPLDLYANDIYQLKTEIGYFEGDNLSYYYNIVAGTDVFLPNGGKELTRKLVHNDSIQEDWFNNQKRIARFTINPQAVDYDESMYIGIWHDGRIAQSDELVRIQNNLLETAFVVPNRLENMQWAIIDARKKPLTDLHEIDIDDNGVWIKM